MVENTIQYEDDEYTDDELRALLMHLMSVIHNGTPPSDITARVNEVIRRRGTR